MWSARLWSALISLIVLAAANPSLGLSLGQSDDFEDGTKQGWAVGFPLSSRPTNVSSGGPDGAGDAYLEYESFGGAGPTGRMVFFNGSQWTGDYLSAGIGAISAQVNNLSSNETLMLRLAFGSSLSADLGSWYASSDAIVLGPGSGWQPVVFSILESDLTRVLGLGTHGDVLGDVAALRILSSASPAAKGDMVVGTLGVDDIRAIGAPEAATLPWLAALFGALLARTHRRRC